MLVTLSGIVTVVSELQYENASLPMLVTLSGIVTVVSKLQPRNASLPIKRVLLLTEHDVIVSLVVSCR